MNPPSDPAPARRDGGLDGHLQCRGGCAACCIAPSISTAIPGMPGGKPAGVPCVQLDDQLRCRLFGQPQRPAVCGSLAPSIEMCGADRRHALLWLAQMEAETAPALAVMPRPAQPPAGCSG